MAFSKGSKANWSEVKTTYSNLNSKATTIPKQSWEKYGRLNFGFNDVSVPEHAGDKFVPNHISVLSAFISEMAANAFLASIAKGVDPPGVGAAISFTFMASLDSTVTAINNTCPFDTSNRSNYSNFTSNRSDYSNFTSNRSDYSNFTSNRSDYSNFTSNRSDYSNFTSNRSDYSNYTTNRSNHSNYSNFAGAHFAGFTHHLSSVT